MDSWLYSDAVLCDYRNHKIKLLDSSGVLTGNTSLSSDPWDVSVFDSASVTATLPSQKRLQVVQIYPKMKPGKVIQLDKKCWGVEVVKEEIYTTCHNSRQGEVMVLGVDGQVKRRLGVHQDGSFMFTEPYYITVNQSGEKIFVTDFYERTVTCMSVDGSVNYTYIDSSLGGPTGILCDSEDNILVCGRFSSNIQVLTSDCKRHSILLTASDGIKDPYSIAYRDSDDNLLVGCLNIDNLLSFKLAK